MYKFAPGLGMVLALHEFRCGALKSEFIFKWSWRNTRAGNMTWHRPIEGNSRLYLPKRLVKTKDELQYLCEEPLEVILFATARGLVL